VHFHSNTGYASVPNCYVTHALHILFITVFSLLCLLKMVMKNLDVSDELNIEGAVMLII
jgi:heme/copper-type cytochrome/quinol oxidase subunit 3